MLKTLCLALALAGPAHAGVIGVIDMPDGIGRVDIYSEPGDLCINDGHKAMFVSPAATIAGCWTVQGGGAISVAFLDGDFIMVPFKAIRQPKEV